jgi:hypothetical protein
MLARLNYIARLVRCEWSRTLRTPVQRDLLFAEGAMQGVLQARRAVGIAALVGAAGWVLLSDVMVRRAAAVQPVLAAARAAPVPAQQQVIPACRPLLARAG